MIIFFTVLAVITAGCCWATESIDRPRRRRLRETATDAG
ncbi:MAG: hypothetical protein ACJASD_002816 [Sphingomonas echinoides]|jgi:hypothetical protein